MMKELVEENIPIYGLKLFWLGEPLLHPQFAEILQDIPAKQVNETVVFDTNCQLMDEDVVEAIIRRCRDCKLYIFLSLDAYTKETYDKMRTLGNRDRAYENIHRLLRRRQEAGLDFPKVRIQFIVHENNHHELLDFVNYWQKQPYFTELPVMDAIQDDRDFIHVRRWITGEQQPLADELYEAALEKLGLGGEAMPANVDLRDCAAGDFPCENLFAMPMIRTSGDVTVCNNDVELSLKVGNVAEESFLDVWCGEAINQLRHAHLNNKRCDVQKCANCTSAQRTWFPESMDKMKAVLGENNEA
jgi:radical SAM protein with 4Fe4S-binding SPASM domain